jgi:tRNA(Arg) A34 adenosine deaminase TadA
MFLNPSEVPKRDNISSPMAGATHSPATLVSSILQTTEERIIPLTKTGVSTGSKLFGAAILSRAGLVPLTVATNNERVSPLLHGEINCIQQFFAPSFVSSAHVSPAERPDTKDCIFFATHEPCSLCLSGITWAGFNEFYYLFTYEDSRDLFSIPYDIDILQEVFRVKSTCPEETDEMLAQRPLYNRRNKFFTAKSIADLVEEIEDEKQRAKLGKEVEKIKQLYSGLSETYQQGKATGAETSSVWK